MEAAGVGAAGAVGKIPQVCERFLMRVLVVEDERLIRWSIAETLAHDGHTVLEAESAAEAIATVTGASDPLDAVLLDFRLPDSNDLSLLANIRKLLPAAPVILMTAFGTSEVTQGALDLGVYTVMNKPFEMHDLQDVLRRACHDARSH